MVDNILNQASGGPSVLFNLLTASDGHNIHMWADKSQKLRLLSHSETRAREDPKTQMTSQHRASQIHQLFSTSMAVQTRKDSIVTSVINIEETVESATEEASLTLDWVNKELESLLVEIREVERLEHKTWTADATCQGEIARDKRAKAWRSWMQQVNHKMSSIKPTVLETSLKKSGCLNSNPASLPHPSL